VLPIDATITLVFALITLWQRYGLTCLPYPEFREHESDQSKPLLNH